MNEKPQNSSRWKYGIAIISFAVMILTTSFNLSQISAASQAATTNHMAQHHDTSSMTMEPVLADTTDTGNKSFSIFSTKNFIPRAVCMNRDPWTLALYVAGSFAVFAAYFSIPLLLMRFRKVLKPMLPKVIGVPFLLAALFIFFCGGGHLIDIILIKYAIYNFAAIWTLCTGIVSWAFFMYVVRYLKIFREQIKVGGKKK